MNRLENFVPSRELCLEMSAFSGLNKILSDTLYIWGAAGVQLRQGSGLAISAPTLQEMQALLRSYNATITFEDNIKMFVKEWYLTLVIDDSVAVYNLTSLDEMARACIQLMKGIGGKPEVPKEPGWEYKSCHGTKL